MSPRSPRNVLDTSPYRSSQQPDTSPLRSPRNLSNTSPLYTDRSVGTSPYRSPTNLPDTRYTTESMKNPLERYENTGSVLSSPKQQHNLPVEVNRQRTSPPRCSQVNGYASSLTDIVDSMERATVQDLDNQDTYRPYLAKTPDLFASSNGAANYSNHDDSHILEEVFFLK
uniref:Uncharacterized protein LOC102808125 n=1 Tax=Saccoglossus kowalevskii TaxID=10224 RepID=A0ABM0M093_SACKO|nr:PREDICTED: uncharacterized protein LOC102808125 [Saccoglossus kowalevskii]